MCLYAGLVYCAHLDWTPDWTVVYREFGTSRLSLLAAIIPKILLAVVISVSDDCYSRLATFLNDLGAYVVGNFEIS